MFGFFRLVERRFLRLRQKPVQRPRGKRQSLALEVLDARIVFNVHPIGAVPEHIHPHVAIFVEGENFTIPASVGHTSPGPLIGTFNEDAHTHTDDGIVHFNEGSPAFRDLKEFFDAWGAEFSATRLKLPLVDQPGQFLDKTVDANHRIHFTVNGAVSNDYELYEPEDGDQIIISYEALPAADAPYLEPINNATLLSNPTVDSGDRSLYIPLDGTDPTGQPITYSVSSSSANVKASITPASNRSLRLTISGRDIEGNSFSGDVTIELFEHLTPRTTARIIELTQQGFYNGLTFHRIVNDFVAQGGDPDGDGTGGTNQTFSDEFVSDLTFSGFGQLAMANSGDDTNDSQFFITDPSLNFVSVTDSRSQAPPFFLNFQHTIFGQVTSGFDVLLKVMLTPVDENSDTGEVSSPQTTVRILSASVIDDTQHGVLRLAVAPNASGKGEVTVTATDSSGKTAVRKFETRIITDNSNDRAFLGQVLNPKTMPGTPITISLPATDLENEELTFVVRNPTQFANPPANVTVGIDAANRTATITPNSGFIGTVEMLVGVRDNTRRVDTNGDGRVNNSDNLDAQGNFDTQKILLTVENSSNFTWTNPVDPNDVNSDSIVAPLDALLVINELTLRQVSDPESGILDALTGQPPSFLDPNGDNIVSPLDALLVINALPQSAAGISVDASPDQGALDGGAVDALFSLWDTASRRGLVKRRQFAD